MPTDPATLNRSYVDYKKAHPEVILLFHDPAADVYSAIHEDAFTLQRILGVGLTAAHWTPESPLPTVNIPAAGIERALRNIIVAGRKVALCQPTLARVATN